MLAALVLVGALRSGSDSGTREVTYRGERYESAAVAREADVELAGAVATGDTLDGQRVFAERRTPPRVLFLLRADRKYDAFVLAEESGR